MGLWTFMKDAGKKLSGRAEAGEAPGEDELKKELADLGLDAKGLELVVEGDKVRLGGVAASQELKEKVILAVGNIAGVAVVEDKVSFDDPLFHAGGGDKAGYDDPLFHTVEKGDTLWAVAEKALGDGARYPEILEANRPMLSHPDKIYPGQVLRIPQG